MKSSLGTAPSDAYAFGRHLPQLTIAGMGTALPEFSVAQPETAIFAESFLAPEDREKRRALLKRLFSLSGVTRRSSVLIESVIGDHAEFSFYEPATSASYRGPTTAQRMECYREHAPRLAVAAARVAMAEANQPPEEITHLITVSCTGFAAPGVEFALIESLGLPATVQRLNVGFMGCHGVLNALGAARALAAANPRASILLVSVELCSLHYRYGWAPEALVGNALFADGAGALVLRANDFDENGSAGETSPDWSLTSTASCLLPGTREEMSWHVGDHGFEMTLSNKVADLVAGSLCEWLDAWLARENLCRADIGTWAIHPGGPRILSSAGRALGLADEDMQASTGVLADHGNMSSATILFVLERLRNSQAARPCVALGFGPGLVAEGVLFL